MKHVFWIFPQVQIKKSKIVKVESIYFKFDDVVNSSQIEGGWLTMVAIEQPTVKRIMTTWIFGLWINKTNVVLKIIGCVLRKRNWDVQCAVKFRYYKFKVNLEVSKKESM